MKWKDRMENAKKCGVFSTKDKIDSRHWDTCAIGEKFNLPTMNEREISTMQSDINNNEVIALGMKFYVAVQRDQIDVATEILKKICSLNDSALRRGE